MTLPPFETLRDVCFRKDCCPYVSNAALTSPWSYRKQMPKGMSQLSHKQNDPLVSVYPAVSMNRPVEENICLKRFC
jgi:hypothetical protein